MRESVGPLYAALNADPRVMQWLGGVPLTPADSDEMAAYANGLFAAERIGLLAVERRRDGVFLGMCGLHHIDSLPGEVEVAWRLAYPHWGNGYATEAASAWLDYAFDALGLPRVISVTDPPNKRCLGVMRRLGMTFEREADVEERASSSAPSSSGSPSTPGVPDAGAGPSPSGSSRRRRP